jgi:hypothetical protein
MPSHLTTLPDRRGREHATERSIITRRRSNRRVDSPRCSTEDRLLVASPAIDRLARGSPSPGRKTESSKPSSTKLIRLRSPCTAPEMQLDDLPSSAYVHPVRSDARAEPVTEAAAGKAAEELQRHPARGGACTTGPRWSAAPAIPVGRRRLLSHHRRGRSTGLRLASRRVGNAGSREHHPNRSGS